MKGKLLIFMCSLMLTLATTESASAATEWATGLVLAANETAFPNSGSCPSNDCDVDPGDNNKKCPAKSKDICENTYGGDYKDGVCTIKKMEKTKFCKNGNRKVTTKTVLFKFENGKCKKMQKRHTECQKKKGNLWIPCPDKACKPC